MNLKKPIELDVLWWRGKHLQLNNLVVRPSLEEVGARPITFYSIDHIAAYTENNNEYCTIWSGGQDYIVIHTYNQVKSIIATIIAL